MDIKDPNKQRGIKKYIYIKQHAQRNHIHLKYFAQ